MAARSTVRNVAEAALFSMVVAIARILPRNTIPGFCRCLGSLLALLVPSRRRVVRENVARAFPGVAGAPDARTLARSSFGNLARAFLELFLLPANDGASWIRARVRVCGPEGPRATLRLPGQGPVIYCASHYGAWEVGGALGGVFGDPTTTLVRPLDNPLLERRLAAFRMRFGQQLATNRGGLGELLEALRGGRSVVVLVDLNMRRQSAIFVDYFGVPAATAPTAATLAQRTGCPLVPVFVHREAEPFRFTIELGNAVLPDPEPRDRGVEAGRLMQDVTRQLELRVRARPAEWIWTHRRWKTRPDSDTTAEKAHAVP